MSNLWILNALLVILNMGIVQSRERERDALWIDLYALVSARVVNWNVVVWSRKRNAVRISQFSFQV